MRYKNCRFSVKGLNDGKPVHISTPAARELNFSKNSPRIIHKTDQNSPGFHTGRVLKEIQ